LDTRGVFLRPAAGVLGAAFGLAPLLIGAGGFQHALAGPQLVGGQAKARGAALGRTLLRRLARLARLQRLALLRRGRASETAHGRGRRIAPPLGLDDHGLGTSMAEALLDRAGADGALARFQAQGRAAP
jgi:hypothetical protein